MEIQPFETERFFALHEFTAPYLLCTSDCESLTIAELLKLADAPWESLAKTRLGYTESQGAPELRRCIARLYSRVTANQVVGLSAPEEGIFLTLHALLERGDQVIVLTPCYNSLLNLVEHIGCRVVAWPLVEPSDASGQRGRWQLDLDRLKHIVTPQTKLVILNFPHNPTGYLPSRTDWKEIIEIVAGTGAWLFSDEMYRGLELEGERLEAGCDLYDRAISLAGLSKVHGLPGLRVGWLALADETLRNRIQTWKDYTTICSSAPSEVLATVALSIGDKLIARSRALVSSNLALGESFFARWPSVFQWNPPQAGSIAFPRVRNQSAQEFSERVLADQGVLLLPSPVFRFGDHHVRFGFGRAKFHEGLAQLEQYLDRARRSN